MSRSALTLTFLSLFSREAVGPAHLRLSLNRLGPEPEGANQPPESWREAEVNPIKAPDPEDQISLTGLETNPGLLRTRPPGCL